MGRQVYINVKVGNSDVDQDKLDRAEAAALAVIAASGSTVDQVRAEFVRQWAWLATDEAVRAGRFQEYAYLEGLALVWANAEAAARVLLRRAKYPAPTYQRSSRQSVSAFSPPSNQSTGGSPLLSDFTTNKINI